MSVEHILKKQFTKKLTTSCGKCDAKISFLGRIPYGHTCKCGAHHIKQTRQGFRFLATHKPVQENGTSQCPRCEQQITIISTTTRDMNCPHCGIGLYQFKHQDYRLKQIAVMRTIEKGEFK